MKTETSFRKPSHRASCLFSHVVMWGLFATVPGCGKEGAATGVSASSAAAAAEALLDHPAHAAEAAQRLDLTSFPLMPGASDTRQRTIANLSYRATGDAKTAYAFQQKELLAQKWTELPNSSVTDQYASGTFSRAGFVVSVMAYPSDAGKVDITLHNHGNVDLSKLPLPAGTTPMYVGPVSAMHVTEAPVAATADACEKLLLSAGWQPYGTAGDTRNYKQNAVRLLATVSQAPAQGGKTMISYSTEQMSADIPAMPSAQKLQYADSSQRLDFETADNEDAVSSFYRRELAAMKWEATLDKSIDIDGKNMVIFRNPTKDMLTLEMKTYDSITRVALLHQTAAEVDALDMQVKAQGDRIRKKLAEEKNKPALKVSISLPAGTKVASSAKTTAKLSPGNGQAKTAVDALRKQFTESGWREDSAIMEPMAGSVSLSKEGQTLSVTYTDVGVVPAEIDLSLIGAELELTGSR